MVVADPGVDAIVVVAATDVVTASVVVASVVVASVVEASVVVASVGVVATVVIASVVVAGTVVVVGTGVGSVGTIFSNASYAASSLKLPPTALLEDNRQREEEALNEMDRHVVSAVHLALHASTSSSFVCLPIRAPVIPEPVPRDS